MKNSIKSILHAGGWFSVQYAELMADKIVEFILTPEFAELYCQQVPRLPDPGLGTTLKTLEIAMSKLTDAMTALGQQIAAANSPANTAHLQAIDDHLSQIDTKEVADEAALADTTAGLQALLDAATATGTPAPTPAPAA